MLASDSGSVVFTLGLAAVHGLKPQMAHTCILGPDISGLQATSFSSHLSSSSSSSHVLVSLPPLCRQRKFDASAIANSSPSLPPLSSSTLPRVSTSSHGQPDRKKVRRGSEPRRSQRSGRCKAAKLKTLEHVKVFQPPLGWPFSGPSEDLLCTEKQEEREMVPESERDTVYDEPSSSTVEGMYQSWFVQPDASRSYFLPVLTAAVQSTPPPRQKQESSEGDNFYVNCGSAIRTLREELPSLFYKELNYDIYREDITFRDPMNTFAGMDNYKTMFWALRFHGRIFFKALWVDIVRVWQPSDKVIMVRWTVRGIPRVPWEAQGHFDGTSEYKLDKDGKIYEHKVDNVIMNSPPKFQARSVMDLVRVAAGQTTPTPSFYQRAGIFYSLFTPYLEQFTWVRFYLALRSTLALTNTSDCCTEMVPSPSLNP